jgi:hypothetical protein
MMDLSPKEKAKALMEKCSGSKNMAIWLQEEVINVLVNHYGFKSENEKQVLIELKSVKK